MISVEISKSRPRNLVFLTNNYFKHKEVCFICLPNNEKWIEKTRHSDFKVFGKQIKDSFKCLQLSWRNSKQEFTECYNNIINKGSHRELSTCTCTSCICDA